MRLDIRRLEKRFKTARKEFLRTARVVLERGLELVDRYEDKPAVSEGNIHLKTDEALPKAKKSRKTFDKDLVKNGVLANQAGMLGTHKIHRRTARHH